MKIVITELGYISRLFGMDYLTGFSKKDMQFFITGYSFDSEQTYGKFNDDVVSRMLAVGILKVVELNESENHRAALMSLKYPNFLFESIASLVYADQKNFNFFTEDTTLMGFAYEHFQLEIHSKGLFVSALTHKLSSEDLVHDKRSLMAI